MDKIMVDFIMVASSIYHCFFSLDPSLVTSDLLSLGSLFEASKDLLSVAVSFSC